MADKTHEDTTVGNHSLGWSFVLGQLAFAEGQSGSPGIDPRMERLNHETKSRHRVYLAHIQNRDAGFEAAAKMAAEIRCGEKSVDYNAPLPRPKRNPHAPRSRQ